MEIRGQRCSTSWTPATSRISMLMCVLYPHKHLHGSFSKNQRWVDGPLSCTQRLHHHNFLHNISLVALRHLYPSLLIFVHILIIGRRHHHHHHPPPPQPLRIPAVATTGLPEWAGMQCRIVPCLLPASAIINLPPWPTIVYEHFTWRSLPQTTPFSAHCERSAPNLKINVKSGVWGMVKGYVTRVCMCRWDIWTEGRGRCSAKGREACSTFPLVRRKCF